MRVLLINDNQIVQRLIDVATNKLGLELQSLTKYKGVTLSSEYVCVIIDDAIRQQDIDSILRDANGVKTCLLYQKGKKLNKEKFDITIQKPFLPTEILEIISRIMPKDSPKKPDISVDAGALNALQEDTGAEAKEDDVEAILADASKSLIENENSPSSEGVDDLNLDDFFENELGVAKQEDSKVDDGLDLDLDAFDAKMNIDHQDDIKEDELDLDSFGSLDEPKEDNKQSDAKKEDDANLNELDISQAKELELEDELDLDSLVQEKIKESKEDELSRDDIDSELFLDRHLSEDDLDLEDLSSKDISDLAAPSSDDKKKLDSPSELFLDELPKEDLKDLSLNEENLDDMLLQDFDELNLEDKPSEEALSKKQENNASKDEESSLLEDFLKQEESNALDTKKEQDLLDDLDSSADSLESNLPQALEESLDLQDTEQKEAQEPLDIEDVLSQDSKNQDTTKEDDIDISLNLKALEEDALKQNELNSKELENKEVSDKTLDNETLDEINDTLKTITLEAQSMPPQSEEDALKTESNEDVNVLQKDILQEDILEESGLDEALSLEQEDLIKSKDGAQDLAEKALDDFLEEDLKEDALQEESKEEIKDLESKEDLNALQKDILEENILEEGALEEENLQENSLDEALPLEQEKQDLKEGVIDSSFNLEEELAVPDEVTDFKDLAEIQVAYALGQADECELEAAAKNSKKPKADSNELENLLDESSICQNDDESSEEVENKKTLEEDLINLEQDHENITQENLQEEILNVEEALNEEEILNKEEALSELEENSPKESKEKSQDQDLQEEFLQEENLQEEDLNEENLNQEIFNQESFNQKNSNAESLNEEALNNDALESKQSSKENKQQEALEIEDDTISQELLNEDSNNQSMSELEEDFTHLSLEDTLGVDFTQDIKQAQESLQPQKKLIEEDLIKEDLIEQNLVEQDLQDLAQEQEEQKSLAKEMNSNAILQNLQDKHSKVSADGLALSSNTFLELIHVLPKDKLELLFKDAELDIKIKFKKED